MNQPRARPNLRPDHNGTQRAQFESNKKKIYAKQEVCGICGKPVVFSREEAERVNAEQVEKVRKLNIIT